MSNKNSELHEAFERVITRLEAREILQPNRSYNVTGTDLNTILEHANWFEDYLRSRKAAAGQVKNPGRKKSPDADVKPGSLYRREYRLRKKQEQAEG